MLFASTLAIALSAAGVASAAAVEPRAAPEGRNAIIFSYPASRDYVKDGTGPCGNPAARSNPDAFPMTNGDILLDLVRDMANVTLAYAPTSQSDNVDAFKSFLPDIRFLYPGTSCNQAPDWASLGFSVGDAVTIQTTGRGGKNNNLGSTCTDIVLVADDAYSAPSYECVNTVRSVSINGPGNQDPERGTTGSGSSKTTSEQVINPLQAGFIGACAVIALGALTSAALYFTGFKVGKKSKFSNRPMLNTTESRSDSSSFHSTQKA